MERRKKSGEGETERWVEKKESLKEESKEQNISEDQRKKMKLARRKAKRDMVYLKSSGIPCLFYILKIPTCHIKIKQIF